MASQRAAGEGNRWLAGPAARTGEPYDSSRGDARRACGARRADLPQRGREGGMAGGGWWDVRCCGFWLRAAPWPCALVPLCPCALVPLCPCALVPLCPCALVPLCPGVSASLHSGVFAFAPLRLCALARWRWRWRWRIGALAHWRIGAFVRSCVRAFVRSCVRAFVRSCVRASVRLPVCASRTPALRYASRVATLRDPLAHSRRRIGASPAVPPRLRSARSRPCSLPHPHTRSSP